MGLIVDTSEFVNIERKGGEPKDIVQLYGSNELYGVSTMTIAELQHGVRRADGEGRRSIRQQFLDNVLDSFPVYPMDVDIVLRLGNLDAKLQMIGMKGQIPDLIIAATALQYGYDVATRNIDDFSRIPRIENSGSDSEDLIQQLHPLRH